MATKVKNNMGAIRSLNTLNKNARAAQKNLRKVSTGERINSAEDDASAYGISERMREKIRSLDQANDNAQNDLAMMRTAEGAVANIVDALRTLKQKAIDSANDSNTDDDRRIMQKEVDQLLDQIDDNALVTFNGKFLVNGQMSGLSFPVGAVWVAEGLYAPDENEFTNGSYYFDIKLTDLKARDGTSLKIDENDTFTVTHVVNGKTYTRTEKVGDYTLDNLCYATGTPGIPNAQYFYPDGHRFPALAAGRLETSIPLARHSGSGWTDAGRIAVMPTSFDYNGTGELTGIAAYDGSKVGNEGDGVTIGAVVDKNGKPVIAVPSDTSHGYACLVSADSKYQLAGFNITIFDGNGIKKDATRALKFKQIQRGEGGATGGATNYSNGGLSSTAATFHVGAGANQSMTVGLSDMRSKALGLKSADGTQTISIKTRDDALAAMTAFDCAIEGALDQLTSIGALEARIEYTINNITASTENVQASDSTIRDADMAREFTNYTRDNILTQAAQAMLAQANQDASSILGLLS